MNAYGSSGDLGDVIYSLAACKHLGEGDYYLFTRPWTKEMTMPRFLTLKPLLESQPYIRNAVYGERLDGPLTHDFSTFRNGGLPYGESLAHLHYRWVAPKSHSFPTIGALPWLENISPDPRGDGRIVIHRSFRYRNPYFRWEEVGVTYGDKLLALGFQDEVEDLRKVMGFPGLEYLPTNNYFEMARVIKASTLFIGNQSSPLALAIGLGVPFIQETCLHQPDCLFQRENGQFVYDGGMFLPGENPRLIPGYHPVVELSPMMTPTGGWVYRDPDTEEVYRGVILNRVADEAARGHFDKTGERIPVSVMERRILDQMQEKVSEHERERARKAIFGQIESLLTEKGLLPVICDGAEDNNRTTKE